MESELSGVFWVKLVAKNIVLGSPGTHFMHMRVKVIFFCDITDNVRWCKQWFGTESYAVATMGSVMVSVLFRTKVTIFLKSCVWNLDGNAKNVANHGGDVENQGENLGIAVEMK